MANLSSNVMDGRRGIQAYLFDRAALIIEALLRFAVIERVYADVATQYNSVSEPVRNRLE